MTSCPLLTQSGHGRIRYGQLCCAALTAFGIGALWENWNDPTSGECASGILKDPKFAGGNDPIGQFLGLRVGQECIDEQGVLVAAPESGLS
jgi:hypothetical protein